MARISLSGTTEGRGSGGFFAALRVLVVMLLTVFVFFALLYSIYVGYTDIRAEDVELDEHALEADESGRKVSYGRSWMARRGRLWEMHLEGSAEEMGAAHGQLAGRLHRDIEDQLDTVLADRYRASVQSWAEKMLLRWDFRASDVGLRPHERRQLSAMSAALPKADDREFSTYHRLFLYQCFMDLAERLQDVVVNGTMFAVAPRTGSSVADTGNLVIGRSLTLDVGEEFDVDTIVSFNHPDGKYPYVSIGWAGMVGSVTGINARGIFVAGNPARTEEPREEKARPLPLVLREILEEADTLDQALTILREADLRTSAIVMIGDGVQREAIIVECTARAGHDEHCLVRGDDEPVVWATDHMVREAFESDAENERMMRQSSSGYRYERLEELLGSTGSFDPPAAREVLRDRRGHDNIELGLGNRNAIENLRVSHSVVVDATAMVLWVAEGPSTLGRYRAFDLRHRLGRQGTRPAPLDDFSSDRLLHSEEYTDYREALANIEYARYLMQRGEMEEARSAAHVGLALAPDLGVLHRLLGDIERERGEPEVAKEHYRRYLDLVPGRLRDRDRVLGIIDELGG
jgi:tetratricopeptide (TPR) repeat protein